MKTKRIMTCLVIAAVAVAFIPASTFAAPKKVKMTAYDSVIKSGNTVYCAGAGDTIYKVKLKKGKVKNSKALNKDFAMGAYTYVSGMKKKGKYIYYQLSTEGTPYYLYRVHITKGKAKKLASANDLGQIDYAIKGKKIYYKPDDGKKRVMKLNGKSKKTTSVQPVMKHKNTNKKGYSVKYKKKGNYIITYLKTPKGTYSIGKMECW